MIGHIHSIQTLGAVDGPGLRTVVFMQGCNLRCGCCHNPDTWETDGGTEYSAQDVFKIVLRNKPYFGNHGGLTVSGGEPLLQADFIYELFELCHRHGINTCLDTSGSILNDAVIKVLSITDIVLLDIKYTNDTDYIKYVGCSINLPLKFLDILNSKGIPTILRQVIIPTLNDTEMSIRKLKTIADLAQCVCKIELLPFRKLCSVKYDNFCLDFRFRHFKEASDELCVKLSELLKT